MSESICIHMNGSKCAMEYCDYWDLEEQRCSLALESHKRVESMNALLDEIKKEKDSNKMKQKIENIIKQYNIVPTSAKMQ